MTLPTARWRPLITDACRYAAPVPEDVLEAIVVIESAGDPSARSVSGALGLTQIIPRWHADVLGQKVAADLGLSLTDATWFDPRFSLFAGARLLKGHYGECGSWTGAVRKYHSGSCSPPAGFTDGGGTSSDQHIARYLKALQHVREDRAADEQPQEDTGMALNFDPSLVPFPAHEHRWALNKKDGVGQDDFGPRTHRGITWHRGVTGGQTLDQAVDYLLNPSVRGLADGYIDNRTGRVVMMNPMKAMFPSLPAWWEDRAGWTNGPWGGDPFNIANVWPDSRAFVEKYGSLMTQKGYGRANIINQDLENFEILGNYTTELLEPAKAVIVQIQANRAQLKKIPWDNYPINPHTGLTEIYFHYEHCGKAWKVCPGEVVAAFINGESIERTRAVLKRAQTSGVVLPAPAPAPTPPSPTGPTPDVSLLVELFGGADGFAFDPSGVISSTWLDEGNKTGRFPRLLDTVVEGNVRSFVFSDGLVLQNEIGTGKVERLTKAA